MRTEEEIKGNLEGAEKAMEDIRSRESMYFNEENRNSYLRLKGYVNALEWVLSGANND